MSEKAEVKFERLINICHREIYRENGSLLEIARERV